MQGLPAQPFESLPRHIRQLCLARLEPGPIGSVTHERMPDVGHVNADLVGPASFQHQASSYLAALARSPAASTRSVT